MLKKFFNWSSHFPQIRILLILTYTHICTQRPPKNFLFFFGIWVLKIHRILRWSQICGNNSKKIHPEKAICQKLLQVSSIEEKNILFFTLFFGCNSSVGKSLKPLSTASKSEQNPALSRHPHPNFAKRSFHVYKHFFFNFKVQFTRNGSKFRKTCFREVS